MRFSWKVTLATLCILVASFSAGSYLLVSLSFRSALEREIGVAQEEMQMLRISYEAVCAAKGVTLENIDTAGRRVARTLEEDPFFENRQFQVTTESGRPIYSALSAASDRELLESIDEQSTGYTTVTGSCWRALTSSPPATPSGRRRTASLSTAPAPYPSPTGRCTWRPSGTSPASSPTGRPTTGTTGTCCWPSWRSAGWCYISCPPG